MQGAKRLKFGPVLASGDEKASEPVWSGEWSSGPQKGEEKSPRQEVSSAWGFVPCGSAAAACDRRMRGKSSRTKRDAGALWKRLGLTLGLSVPGAPAAFVPSNICTVAADRGFHPKAGIKIWDSATLGYKPLPALKDVTGNLHIF